LLKAAALSANRFGKRAGYDELQRTIAMVYGSDAEQESSRSAIEEIVNLHRAVKSADSRIDAWCAACPGDHPP